MKMFNCILFYLEAKRIFKQPNFFLSLFIYYYSFLSYILQYELLFTLHIKGYGKIMNV